MVGDNGLGAALWWRRVLLFVKPPVQLGRSEWALLLVLGTTNVVNAYDFSILTLALPQIQSGLEVSEEQIGGVISVIRLGVIPALLLTALADRNGRRRLLLLTIVGFTVATFLTAFARTPAQFMLLQFLARMFIAAEDMLAVVVLAEELDARARGWGIGLFIAFGGIGHGLGSVLFSRIETLPYGWRALSAIGVLPLLWIAWYRRGLKETRRFEAHRASQRSLPDLWRPFRRLVSAYPGRLSALVGAVLPCYFMLSTALAFQSKFLQEQHGFSPGRVALLTITGGAVALFGNLAAGAFSDVLGRRPVLIGALLLNAAAVGAFYNSPAAWIIPVWVLMFFTFFGLEVLFSAFGAELFPTSYRSTASGVRALAMGLGTALGLWLEGGLYGLTGSHGSAVTWMLAVALVSPLVVAFWVPETAGRELEEIAPD
ncbi:MAG: MFS transporter [Holophagales bacterium]|nr:MFS transporter [Holophagales bacterium]